MKKAQPSPTRGARTRLAIIAAAASLFHHSGYAGTGLDELVALAGVTKGSFYHHFASKKDVALAVIREVVADKVRRRMIDPVVDAAEPLQAIRRAVARLRKEVPPDDLLSGCPLNNLASELALKDEDLRAALAKLFGEWEAAWTQALRREMGSGRPHDYKDPRELSLYLIALIEGAQAMAKAHQSREPLDAALKRVETFLATV